MQSTDLVQPLALQTPFAINGNKVIPSQNASGTDTSSINLGFLPITSEPLDDGGLPPERTDFNGMFYLSTDQRVFLQNGGFITYDDNVATAIGGYPKGAILGYLDSNNNFDFVVSLVENNQNTNFNTNPAWIDGTYWAYADSGKINKSRSISLTGAVTGSANFNLATGNSIVVSTTGKSKTISLSGAVTGSATLNTGNTSSVTITTTGKSKTVSLTGAVTGSATFDTGNNSTVSIATSYDSKITGNRTLTLTGDVTGNTTFNLANSNSISVTTTFDRSLLPAFMPDYSAGVSCPHGFKAPSNGIVCISTLNNGGTQYVSVNGNQVVLQKITSSWIGFAAQIPVSKNDIIDYNTSAVAGNPESDNYFFPYVRSV